MGKREGNKPQQVKLTRHCIEQPKKHRQNTCLHLVRHMFEVT